MEIDMDMDFHQSVSSQGSTVSNNSSITSNSVTTQAAEGTLVVIVCRAKHLPNRRKLDKQSPYVTMRLGTVAKKTPSHFRAGQTPDWTYEVRFQLTRDRKPIIRLDVLDETKNDPTPIGTCEIDGSVIFGNENQRDGKYIYDKWYDLSLNGRRAGQIYLEMTFYPTAPVLPPKLYENVQYEETSANFRNSTSSYMSNNSGHASVHGGSQNGKGLPMPPPQHPSKSRKPSVVDDIFVNEDNLKKRNKFFNNIEDALGSSSSSVEPDTEPPEDNDEYGEGAEKDKNFKQKYYAKFNKFTKKFQSKEPVSHFWNIESKDQHQRVQKISPLDTKEFDNLDDLERDIQNNRSEFYNLESFEMPPSPPAHSVNLQSHPLPPSPLHNSPNHRSPQHSPSRHEIHHSPQHHSYGHYAPSTPSKAPKTPSKSPNRKPPPSVTRSMENLTLTSPHTTAVPFSADSIGIDEEGDNEEALPTKVYFMDQQVKSLSYSCNPFPVEPENLDEISPKYYAPTPHEHFNNSKNRRQDRKPIDYRTKETGYLGDGQWDKKFSPSIFDRMTINDENLGFENKPNVPPKIPSGLSEKEYYVLDKEKYLVDINGRRN